MNSKDLKLSENLTTICNILHLNLTWAIFYRSIEYGMYGMYGMYSVEYGMFGMFGMFCMFGMRESTNLLRFALPMLAVLFVSPIKTKVVLHY